MGRWSTPSPAREVEGCLYPHPPTHHPLGNPVQPGGWGRSATPTSLTQQQTHSPQTATPNCYRSPAKGTFTFENPVKKLLVENQPVTAELLSSTE